LDLDLENKEDKGCRARENHVAPTWYENKISDQQINAEAEQLVLYSHSMGMTLA
jgi:hypothetical protein